MTSFASFRLPVLALGAVLVLSACDAALDPASTADLTTAEADEAAQILAEALAEDDGGLMASFRDLTASVADSGMTDDSQMLPVGTDDVRPPCRGDYRLTYAEDTGTHFVDYRCGFQSDHTVRRYVSHIGYQFRDADGGFLPRPWETWDTVDSVYFRGTREGFLATRRRDPRHDGSFRAESQFEQNGQWTLSRLADDATPAVLAGRQLRRGSHTRVGPGGRGRQRYALEMGSREILIREDENGLTYAARGELHYTLTIQRNRDCDREDCGGTRVIEGTVSLEGNGRALLRILGLGFVYRVSLGDGESALEV